MARRITPDDARKLLVDRYGQMVKSNRRDLYGSVSRAIGVAAKELVAERLLPPDMVEAAVREATAFIARGERSR